jgi:3-oxoacyl-[acyl-carrier-protein] synthase III
MIAISQAVMHSTDVLNKTGWPLDSFQHLIMHQTSETSLHGAAREINQRTGQKVCHPGNVVNNLAERGNTATTTHFVAVMDHILNHKIRTGDRVVFGVSGSGQTTGTALYIFDDLPDRIRRAKLGGKSPTKVAPEPLPRPRTTKRVRIESVGTVPPEPSDVDGSVALVKRAAEDCLARSIHERSSIDLLLFAGVYRDEFICEPAIATMATGELRINDTVESPEARKTFAFDVFNGGIGFLNACHMGVQMIRAGKSLRVMVAASEVENNARIKPELRRGVRETGSALILDEAEDGRTGFGGFVFKYATDHIGDFEAYTHFADGKTFLDVEQTGELEAHYLQTIPDAVEALLEAEGLTLDQIKVVVPPQISSEFITELAAWLNVPRERMVDVAAEDADLFTSSLACALRHALDRGLVRPGDVGLIISAGAGVQVGCAIYYF